LLVGGLDLAAKESRCSGYAVIKYSGSVAEVVAVKCLSSDDEIIDQVIRDGVKVLAVDAPLMSEPRMRDLDRELIRMGLRVFPPSFRWMRDLTLRAWRLREKLLDKGVEVIETHPRSVLRYAGVGGIDELLTKLNVHSGFSGKLSGDVADALVCALVSLCYVLGCSEKVSAADGTLYMIRSSGFMG